MEYPGSFLTRKKRLALLGLAYALFFIITPLILLYSIGYRINWRGGGILKEAGGLSIDEITPKNGLSVFLNTIPIRGSLPIRLKNITPNSYQLRLSAPGYYDFEKWIEVKNKETRYIKQLMLLKKSEPKLVTPGAIHGVAMAPNSKFIAYIVKTGNEQKIFILNQAASSTALVQTEPAATAITLRWAERGALLAIETMAASSTLLVLDAERMPMSPAPFNVTGHLGKKIKKFEWASSGEPQMYLGTEEHIYFFDFKTGQIIPVVENTFIDWLETKNQLWVIKPEDNKKNNLLLVKDILGFSASWPLTQAFESQSTTPWRLAGAFGDTAVLKQKNTPGVHLRYQGQPVPVNGDEALHSPLGDWWIFWDSSEIWGYTPGSGPTLLSRTGEHVKSVVPIDEVNTLAVIWPSHVTALFPYFGANQELIRGSISELVPDASKRILYFTGTIKGASGLWSLAY